MLLLIAFYIKNKILDKFKFKKNAIDKRLNININKPKNLKKVANANIIDYSSNVFLIPLVQNWVIYWVVYHKFFFSGRSIINYYFQN